MCFTFNLNFLNFFSRLFVLSKKALCLMKHQHFDALFITFYTIKKSILEAKQGYRVNFESNEQSCSSQISHQFPNFTGVRRNSIVPFSSVNYVIFPNKFFQFQYQVWSNYRIKLCEISKSIPKSNFCRHRQFQVIVKISEP